jgi:drug/metabolite transporter (DMT)-like permease
MAIESLAPTELVSARYLLSGSILLLVVFLAGAHLPRGKELLFTALFGLIMIGIGNTCLAFAELWIPSGIAAVFITTSPFWMIGMEALIPGGERLHMPTIFGMLVGVTGTLLLVAPGAIHEGFGGPMLKGFLTLQVGCCGWAFGSILHRRHATKAHPVVGGAVQQLTTGLVFIGPALLMHHRGEVVTARSAGAVVYLVIFGSIVGYSAYSYALAHLPVSVVTLYTFVNPVVALFLGWLFYREPIGVREVSAMLVIFAGVGLVQRYSRHGKPRAARVPVSVDIDEQHTAV